MSLINATTRRPVTQVTKSPAEIKHFTFDYTEWLCVDEVPITIESVQAYPVSIYNQNVVFIDLALAKEVDIAVQAFATVLNGQQIGLVVSNGQLGSTYQVSVIVEASDGRREEDALTVKVLET